MTLPLPERNDLPHVATIAVPVPSGGLTVYRLMDGQEPRQKDFEPTYTPAAGAALRERGIPTFPANAQKPVLVPVPGLRGG